MSAGDVESWARLRLVQGESTAQVWELVRSVGQTVLSVGSDAGCSWSVRDEGVAPMHFSLLWDGAVLRIADTFGAGGVHVDGAPVTAQWRALSGRQRIDFGKAAIVVETSPVGRAETPHPLDPTPLPRAPDGPGVSTVVSSGAASDVSGRGPAKPTLMGVPPMDTRVVTPTPPSLVEAAPSPVSPRSEPAAGATGSFRPIRAGDAERAHKPTLLGVSAVPPPPPADAPELPSATGPSVAAAAQGPRVGGVPSGTLLGVGMPSAEDLRALAAQRLGGASLGEEQRTFQGYAAAPTSEPKGASSDASRGPEGRRLTHRGMGSEPPGVERGAVARAPVRAISSQPPPRVAVGSTWQEVPEDTAAAERERNRAAAWAQAIPAPYGASRDAAGPGGTGSASASPPASIASSRPTRPFPWRYVGMTALTVLAYFAWLYLLDHF